GRIGVIDAGRERAHHRRVELLDRRRGIDLHSHAQPLFAGAGISGRVAGGRGDGEDDETHAMERLHGIALTADNVVSPCLPTASPNPTPPPPTTTPPAVHP